MSFPYSFKHPTSGRSSAFGRQRREGCRSEDPENVRGESTSQGGQLLSQSMIAEVRRPTLRMLVVILAAMGVLLGPTLIRIELFPGFAATVGRLAISLETVH